MDFSVCYPKYENITSLIPVSKNRCVTFDKPSHYLYHDEFTGMYVLRCKNSRVVYFLNRFNLGWWMAGIKKGAVYGGTAAQKMKFLNPAKLSVKIPENSIVSDLFCRTYGIGDKRGDFITGEYIKHFVKYGYWGSLGIGVNDKMIVTWVDPFYVKGIKPGDKILRINSKPANVENFDKYVILGKIGEVVVVTTQKGSFPIKIRKKIYNFTPLMHYGIIVNKNLEVLTLPKWIEEKYFIKPPAKLIKIDSKPVYTFDMLKKLLSFNKNVTITLEKEGIKINIPLRK
jgi:hypothetical protein